MATIRVVIPDDTADQLMAIARRELRAPRQQAAVLLADAIERAVRSDAKPKRPTRPVQM